MRPWAQTEKNLLAPYNELNKYSPLLPNVPLIGPLEAVVSLHDAFWKWGYDVGCNASALQEWEDGGSAMLQAGAMAVALAGPAVGMLGKEAGALAKGGEEVEGTDAGGGTGGGGGSAPSVRPSTPAEPFNRLKHYGRTPTIAQKRSVPPGMLFDHNPPLVQHYYEGDGQGGLPGFQMTQAERQAYAKSPDVGSGVPRDQRFGQGGDMKAYSMQMRKLYFGY